MIGSGTWPDKIQSAVKNEWRVSRVPARRFLEDPTVLKFEEVDVIWVCTTPELQNKILHDTSKYSKKIIIEKSFANNKSEMKDLRDQLLIQKGQVTWSQPWTFSEVWEEIKKEINTFSANIQIDVIRGGRKKRNYINAFLDWLPHDFSLLYDLSETKSLENLSSVTETKLSQDFRQYDLVLNKHLKFQIQGGFINTTRMGIWKLRTSEKEKIFDFYPVNNSEDYRFENNILKMLNQAANNPQPIFAFLDFFEKIIYQDFKKK